MKKQFLIAVLLAPLLLFSQGPNVNCNLIACQGFSNRDAKQVYSALLALSGATQAPCSFTSCSPFGNTDMKQIYGAVLTLSAISSSSNNFSWSLSGNTPTNNLSFIGTTNNTSWYLKTNNILRHKTDSNGYNKVFTYGVPANGEPNELTHYIRPFDPALSGNLYAKRVEFSYESGQNNSTERIGALLGVMDIKSTSTGTTGYDVGVFGSATNHGTGYNERNWAGYFVAANRSAGTGTNNNNFGLVAQTNIDSGLVNFNGGIQIRTPLSTGHGSIGVSNIGLHVLDQRIGKSAWAIKTEGINDSIGFAGNVIAGQKLYVGGASTVVAGVMTPSVFGGSGLTSSLVLSGTTNSASAGTSTNIIFQVGGSASITAGGFLNNGNQWMTSGKSFIGINTASAQSTLFSWINDNLTFTGRQGFTDMTFNPTSTSRGMVIRSSGSIGIYGVVSPTGIVTIGTASSSAANTAPLVFQVTGAGLLTNTITGAVEINSVTANIQWTNFRGRANISTVISGSVSLDFPSTLAGAVSDLTVSVTGAQLSDPVTIGIPNGSAPAGAGTFMAWVSSASVLTIRFINNDAVPVDLNTGTFKYTVNTN